ncbi:lactoylglutathione lyase-like lyase [Flavobacterium cauense R2A-7]|uniref:Putative glyoxalase superfamily protein PhnB n=1 Tax=Flavobacterium cauense R2A-7 TaxID=1341154 RepID=V6S5K6_9FLAO|nr:VOC family protein [Flavobacterium cauense]ESU21557.1 lactoylglutathione lyase-like lyase [Flavobacterium cauense R2A-7]TWI10508.1 putative glyoxalase superfamily protein PhnB [Flavobacterium cauense R2A-7]
MIKFQPIRPMLWTNELQETIAFYVNVLGFTCGEYNEDWGWAALHKDEAEIMLAKPNEHSSFEKPLFTGSFYFNVDAVDELWNTIKDKCKICYEIENFEWGMREFAVYDNNGYLLQFGQEINE